MKKESNWNEMVKVVQETQFLANSKQLDYSNDQLLFGCDLLLRSILTLLDNTYVENTNQRDYLYKTLIPGCKILSKGTNFEKQIEKLINK